MNPELKNYSTLAAVMCEDLEVARTLDQMAIRQAFLKRLVWLTRDQKSFIRASEAERRKRREEIPRLCIAYAELFESYWQESAHNSKNEKDYPEASSPKSKARALASSLAKELGHFAVSEFDLHAAAAGVSFEMAQAMARRENISASKDVNWSFDLPTRLRQARQTKEALDKKISVMNRALPIVEKTDFVYATTEEYLRELLDERQGQKIYQDFMEHLRRMRYLKAYEIIAPLHKKNTRRIFQLQKKEKRKKWNILLSVADLMGKLLQKISPALMSPDGTLYLRFKEFKAAHDSVSKSLDSARMFIEENEIGEIKFRQDAIKREMERFYQIAIFEKYLETFENLVSGAVMPMKTLKDVRSFESDVLKKADVILYQNKAAIEQIIEKARKMATSASLADVA